MSLASSELMGDLIASSIIMNSANSVNSADTGPGFEMCNFM